MQRAYGLAWLDGRFVRAGAAAVPLSAHALHYGTSAFEGIRAYWAGGQLRVFRLGDHVRRLRRSARSYRMSMPYTDAQVAGAVVGLCRRNRAREACYVRPFLFVGEHGIELNVTRRAPTHLAVLMRRMGPVFGRGGISVRTSSWRKFSGAATPVQAKMGGNYLNSIAAMQEARRGGYDDAILLDSRGDVSEASAANVFAVAGGRLATPPESSSALMGITRDTVMRLAGDLGYGASARRLGRRQLAGADEVFLTGTAVEVTPVTSIDGRRVGDGRPGPVTERLAAEYARTVAGLNPRRSRWLTGVYG